MAQNDIVLYEPINVPADQHPVAVYIASLSKGSHRTMQAALENIAQLFGVKTELLDWTAIRYQHVQYIRSKLAETYAPATANRHMAALRGVLREVWQLGYMTADEYLRAAKVKPIKGQRVLAGRYLDDDLVEQLINTCLKVRNPNNVRDAAIIGVLHVCGLRRDELVSLDVQDYSNKEVRVIGKGNKERVVPVNKPLQKLIQSWLSIRGDSPGALFYNLHTGKPLTTQAIYSMLKRRGKTVGIDELSPHDFRHTFISNLFDAGVDISTIADLAGHESVETTRRYDRRAGRAKRDAVERLTIPGITDDELAEIANKLNL